MAEVIKTGTINVNGTGNKKYTTQYSQSVADAQATLAASRAALAGGGTYASQTADALNNYLNRGAFAYNANADPLYLQYKDSATRQGKLAMRDTIGQASALTGGYGNSYAQTAGQQVYNGYMQQINDKIPELSEQAYGRYQDEGNTLLQKYSLLADADNTEYSRKNDAYTRALNEFTTYAGLDSTDRSFLYQQDRDSVSDSQWEKQLAYQKGRDAVADDQWAKEYALSQASASSSGSSSSNTASLKAPSNTVIMAALKAYEQGDDAYDQWAETYGSQYDLSDIENAIYSFESDNAKVSNHNGAQYQKSASSIYNTYFKN